MADEKEKKKSKWQIAQESRKRGKDLPDKKDWPWHEAQVGDAAQGSQGLDQKNEKMVRARQLLRKKAAAKKYGSEE